ncbi:hypothetical protein F0919_00385 [Taibaiella lutea]|uniref:Lipoprotein n=1 Tax=Taibaiella lutea TaxID=2608001 RepID=A0A5M6CQB3_9BACT|nr:hypothetical protein [Taibaiella lutea]KAA5536162.1 hypothetical protein F0919_00385 [Taibaiella lutea]
MKRFMILCSACFSLLVACNENPENGGEEVRGNEQRSDTPVSISAYPDEGDSGSNSRYDDGNTQSSKPAMSGKRTTEGTKVDSQKTRANLLYKGDNSDTSKKAR